MVSDFQGLGGPMQTLIEHIERLEAQNIVFVLNNSGTRSMIDDSSPIFKVQRDFDVVRAWIIAVPQGKCDVVEEVWFLECDGQADYTRNTQRRRVRCRSQGKIRGIRIYPVFSVSTSGHREQDLLDLLRFSTSS